MQGGLRGKLERQEIEVSHPIAGGIYVARGVQQHSGVMSLQGCTAELFGGGIFVNSGGFHSQSWLNIQSCLVVNGNGGGLHVNEGNFSSSGPATFTDCAADHGDGGGIYVHGNLTMTGAASFKACSAAYSGSVAASWVVRHVFNDRRGFVYIL